MRPVRLHDFTEGKRTDPAHRVHETVLAVCPADIAGFLGTRTPQETLAALRHLRDAGMLVCDHRRGRLTKRVRLDPDAEPGRRTRKRRFYVLDCGPDGHPEYAWRELERWHRERRRPREGSAE
jgi:hypothetical protein